MLQPFTIWERTANHPVWSAVISGAVLGVLIWLAGYIDLETRLLTAIGRIKSASHKDLLIASSAGCVVFIVVSLIQTHRIGVIRRFSRQLELTKSQLEHELHDELGIVAFRDTARETIELGLSEAKGYYRWQGYSSVNVVTPVPNERTIRSKSGAGVRYEFEILNPDSTHGYLLHALHEGNSDKQGRGYIERALSAIQEMQSDGVNIGYKFSNLPPILRFVTLDSDRIFVGIYPKGKCGIDGKEIEIRNTGEGSLFQFFFEYQKRLQAINAFYDDRDYIIGLLIRRYCNPHELVSFLRNLKISSIKNEHLRIIIKELPHLSTLSRDEVDERTIAEEATPMSRGSEMANLTKSSVTASELNIKIVEHVRAALEDSAPLNAINLSEGLPVTTKRQLLFPGETFKGVKAPSIGTTGSVQRRLLSSWLVHHLFEEKGRHNDVEELPCALLIDGDFSAISQFSLVQDENCLVFWGQYSTEFIAALISAHEAFNPDDFDADGYKK